MPKIIFHATPVSGQTSASWCVLSHYDPNGRVEPYVLQYLGELKRCGFSSVLVTTSVALDDASVTALRQVAAAAIVRENIGYDFGSYKIGIDYLRQKGLTPEQLLLTNDSVFGPFHPLDQVFSNARKHDLYGMTDSFDYHHHLQSYFLLYGKRILQSDDFWGFWDNVELLDSTQPDFKQKIILRYEVGGSQFFLERGYSIASEYPFTRILARAFDDYIKHLDDAKKQPRSVVRPMDIKFNATHRFWDKLLELGFPFLKRELLLVNPTNADISAWSQMVASRSDYDLTMMISAMRNYSGNDDFFFVSRPATVSSLMGDDGTVVLPINPAFRAWQAKFDVPETRRFWFDENLYMDKCPDIKVAFMSGKLESALKHFRDIGHLEGRPSALIRLPD